MLQPLAMALVPLLASVPSVSLEESAGFPALSDDGRTIAVLYLSLIHI